MTMSPVMAEPIETPFGTWIEG